MGTVIVGTDAGTIVSRATICFDERDSQTLRRRRKAALPHSHQSG